MLLHHLKLIFRNFKRYKSTFFINLIGLSTGLATALFIYLWVMDELSVDKFHQNEKQLYQVMVNRHSGTGIDTEFKTPAFLGEALAEEMPEVEYAVTTSSLQGFDNINLSIAFDDINLKEKCLFAGKDFFNAFSYELIQGDPDQVLAEKNSIVISETLALKLFKTTEGVLGKAINLKVKNEDYIVSGIFKDIPSNSTHTFDFLIPWEAYKDYLQAHWYAWDELLYQTYIILKPKTNPNEFNEKITDFITTKYKESPDKIFIKPYSSVYLYGKYENGVQAGGRIEYVKLFSIVAVFILLIAAINFMNLSTAKALGRAKEVGIKKSIGANRGSLIIQFFAEAFLLTLIALLIALVVVKLFLPQFSQLTGKNLFLLLDLQMILVLLGILVVTASLAGTYPALYLSRFKPSTVLKGKLNIGKNEVSIRKGLVVFQFALSIVFIVSVVVVYQQIQLIHTKNLGYNKENIIYFDSEGFRGTALDETFISELRNISGVSHASGTSEVIVNPSTIMTGIHWPGKNPLEEYSFNGAGVMEGMIELLGIEVIEGRSFSNNYQSEVDQIIINEAALEVMGLTDPIGQVIDFYGAAEIVGVAKNFHFKSLYEEIKPYIFILETGAMQFMVKLTPNNQVETLASIQQVYKKFNPGYQFNYKFMDEDYQALYVAEQRVATLSQYFAGLAILISCLGLFGLAAFSAEVRMKEIGIRKVLGSSVFGIIKLLSADFTKLVLIATFFGLPLSYFITYKWLNNFAYSVELEWWYFVSAGIIVLLITWLTVGYQSFKAAKVNPTECLKSE